MADDQIEQNRKIYADKLATANAYFYQDALLLSPPLKRAAYSDRMAWILASMAHLAYDQFDIDVEAREMFIAKLKGGGFELIKTFNSRETDTQAFLAVHDDFAVLAFRGTEVAKKVDMETDASAFKISTLQGEVHKGDVRYLGRNLGYSKRGIPLTRRFFYFLFTVFKFFGPLVGDHAITEYRRKLEATAQKRNTSRRDE